MNAPLSRRSLFGATAALGAVALPAAIPALAGPAEAMSPDAVALLAEFRGVAVRYHAASDRLDAAQEATHHPPEPEALFVRDDDFWLLGCVVPARRGRGRRLSYGFDKPIAELRALQAGPDGRRQAERRDEIVGAWDRWHADRGAAEEASGETAAMEHYRATCDEHEEFLLRLVHLRTADSDVMRIKAAAVLNVWRGEADRFDYIVDRAVADLEDGGSPEDALCLSIVRDLLHGLGAAYRVTA